MKKYWFLIFKYSRGMSDFVAEDTVAEWLRRWTANPMCSARVGSNPIGVVLFLSEKKIYLLLCEAFNGIQGIGIYGRL